MSKRKKILSGVFALIIGLSLALPMRASAADWDHHHDHHWNGWRWHRDYDHDDYGHAWRWHRDHDHYVGAPYAYRTAPYAPGYAYSRGNLPANGEGMIDPTNRNLYWACNSEGHHCHWAPRF
jgi:hypothetical protein